MKFYKRTDVIIIALLLALSLGLKLSYDHFFQDERVKAEIYYYSELIETVALNMEEERSISIPQNPNVIIFLDKEGKIAFVKSDCPDKVCIKTGKIHRPGEFAACLPNGIILKIVPGGLRDDDDADIVIGN
jgi:hypothetical protein